MEMIMLSDNKQPKFEKLGQEIRINIDEQKLTDEDNNTYYKYLQCKVCICSDLTRDKIIETIIKAKYPTYGAELAAQFNGGDELTAHGNWRRVAKDTANELLAEFFGGGE